MLRQDSMNMRMVEGGGMHAIDGCSHELLLAAITLGRTRDALDSARQEYEEAVGQYNSVYAEYAAEQEE